MYNRVTTIRFLLLSLVVLMGVLGSAEGALIDRGNGMIYDDVLDITWLQDANLGGGAMEWNDAVTWADSLSFGGFDDWRLPTMDVNMDNFVVDCRAVSESDCRDNELGYMFYQNLQGESGDVLIGNQGPFSNIEFFHWAGMPVSNDPLVAWVFGFYLGSQGLAGAIGGRGAWAVRDGDVAVIPIPPGLLLFGPAVLGLLGRFGRRTKPLPAMGLFSFRGY